MTSCSRDVNDHNFDDDISSKYSFWYQKQHHGDNQQTGKMSLGGYSLDIVKCSNEKNMMSCSRDVQDHNLGNETFLQSIASGIRCSTMVMITKLEKCPWVVIHWTLSSAQKRKTFREGSRARAREGQRWSHDDCQCLISADVIVSQNLK